MAEIDASSAEQQPLLGQNGTAVPRADDVPASAASGPPSFQRNLGAVEAFAIVISIVIGSGIFTSPGAVDTNVPSPGAALGVWLVGGVLAWTGAATLAELGTAIPGEGGVQPYLQYVFGDVFGFLAAWSWLVAIMPATLAILSIVFVESLSSVTVGVSTTASGGQPLVHKLLSILVLLIVTLANSVSTRASARLNNFFVATKFIAIGAVVVAALAVVVKTATSPPTELPDWRGRNWFDARPTLNPDGTTTDWTQLSSWALLGHYSAALYGALWAYSGWDKAVYVSAELREPARQLPLAIHAALPTIVVCFLAANAAYYVLLPWSIVSTTDSIAVTAFSRLLGPAFGFAAAILVCLVVAGSLLGNSFVSGRMAVAAANKNWIPSVFSVLGKLGLPASGSATVDSASATDSDAPINALFLSATIASVYILFGNFRALLTFNGLGEFTFFFLTVLGAIVLRFREPGLARPYKPLIAAPIAFLLVSGFVVVRGAAFAPAQALILVVLWLIGLAFYYRPRSAYMAWSDEK
ncbi:amino acid transporter [Ophiostoma piceae UAMH 11346]|uniref:Amino acid transporter n=1 Tax=Ophiostoma piceae (strain UAMH 11346) TaxID=1262450 RepID=S3BY19_OPHP1|nr:amino acid transporter [Ophiostoma piceae UAMH 11346]